MSNESERPRRPRGQDGRPQRPGQQSRGRQDRGQQGRGPSGPGPRSTGRRDDRDEQKRPVFDAPEIPEDVEASDLDKFARRELQGLPPRLESIVARHLVMAGTLLHDDPELARKHAQAARARALRNGLVREACGETAYACGKWAEALSEFRAARRMTGRQIYAPMMADCERALKRPAKAIEYDTPEIRAALDDAGGVELTIVVAGARRDLGQVEAALQLLETENLMSRQRTEWLPRLRYAYADTLLAAGRRDDALTWFHRAVAVDGDKVTDAEERAAELEAELEA